MFRGGTGTTNWNATTNPTITITIAGQNIFNFSLVSIKTRAFSGYKGPLKLLCIR